MTASPPTERRLEVVATAALTLTTVVVGVGLARLLVDLSFVGPVVLAAIVTHAVSWGGRRLALGGATGIGLALTAGLTTIVAVRYGLDPGVGDALGADLQDAWAVFQDEGAPAPVVDGFVVAAMAAMVVVAAIGDALAFRAGAAAEAVAPAAGVFVFTSVLGGPDHRVVATAAFLAATLAFWLAHRVARLNAERTWLAAPRGRGAEALLKAGATAAMVGLGAGLLVTPVLPGVDAAPIVDLDGDGDGERVTISPLVEIQTQLVEQADIELFTVRADRPAYWRLTALDRFDGSIWSAGGEYVGADGALADTDGDGERLRQEFEISALAQIWVPAAFEPTRIDPGSEAIEWNPGSASLVVDPDRESSDGLRYTVESSVPAIDATVAATAPGAGPELDGLRTLPEGFSPVAAATAAEVTAGSISPYAAALALQDFFRGSFEYSLDVPPGHGSADIDEFLANRIGYCEQFAGAYAAMARSIGLPARVAVGFTPGTEDPTEAGLYRVRGEHAHAWPEVHLGPLGWVAFEPTPGRGAPGAEAHTGVPPQQVGEPPIGAAATTVPPATTFTLPEAPEGDVVAPSPTVTESPSTGTGDGGSASWRTIAPAVALLLVAGWLVGVPVLRIARRDRARRQAGARPDARVLVEWRRSVDDLGRAGVEREPAETPTGFARRARDELFGADGPAAEAFADLARLATTAAYGPAGSTAVEAGARADRAASLVERRARERTGRARWWLRARDPRRLS